MTMSTTNIKDNPIKTRRLVRQHLWKARWSTTIFGDLKKKHRQTYYVSRNGLTIIHQHLEQNWFLLIRYRKTPQCGTLAFNPRGMPTKVKPLPRHPGADIGSSFHFQLNIRRKLQEQNHQPSFVSIITITITIITIITIIIITIITIIIIIIISITIITTSCAPPVVLALPSRWRWIVPNHATTLMEGTPAGAEKGPKLPWPKTSEISAHLACVSLGLSKMIYSRAKKSSWRWIHGPRKTIPIMVSCLELVTWFHVGHHVSGVFCS